MPDAGKSAKTMLYVGGGVGYGAGSSGFAPTPAATKMPATCTLKGLGAVK
ncbi:hypothetical protein ACNKHV_23910 [Shigella flexneri]